MKITSEYFLFYFVKEVGTESCYLRHSEKGIHIITVEYAIVMQLVSWQLVILFSPWKLHLQFIREHLLVIVFCPYMISICDMA